MPLLQPLGHLSGTQYCIRMTAIDKPENSSTNPEGTPHEEDPAISARQDSSGVRYGDAALQKRAKQGGQKVKKPHAGPILPPGLVIVDKPIGMTSMTVVAIVRRKAGLKAGHAGTLDPLATGVLVVGIGAATKSLDRFMKTRKAYRTEIDLSAFTATDDREGELEPVEVESPPTAEEITAVLSERFTGVFPQLPPNFSAKKVDGRRAYATARRGETPRLPLHDRRGDRPRSPRRSDADRCRASVAGGTEPTCTVNLGEAQIDLEASSGMEGFEFSSSGVFACLWV
jgi:hypothetical protein